MTDQPPIDPSHVAALMISMSPGRNHRQLNRLCEVSTVRLHFKHIKLRF